MDITLVVVKVKTFVNGVILFIVKLFPNIDKPEEFDEINGVYCKRCNNS